MKYLFLTLATALTTQLNAQVVVALHTASGEQMFSGINPFIDAYNAASNGDTIYLPGGTFNFPSPFTKRLAIFGAGIHVDSTQATAKSTFPGTVTFADGSDSSHLEGVRIIGSIQINTDENVDNLVIKRCYLQAFSASGSNPANRSNNLQLTESFISGDVQLQHVSNAIVHNNVFQRLQYVDGGWISNNIFYYSGWGNTFISVNASLVENNYINVGWGLDATNCTFNKNIFNVDPTGDIWNVYNSNYVSLSETAIFVNHLFSSQFEVANYHLLNPTTYIGTTGDEVGIYGGHFPVKEGAVPMNPHIRNVNIAPTTNAIGELSISIEVGAQDQ